MTNEILLKRLSPIALKVWRIEGIVTYIVLLTLTGFMWICASYFLWPSWSIVLIYSILGVFLALAFYEIIFAPIYRWLYWRYAITKDYIQIIKGNPFLKYEIVIPIKKVQFVTLEQGIIARRYNVTNLRIGTLSAVHELPTLDSAIAEQVRDRIISLSNVNPINKETL